MNQAREESNFTDFYFISRNGDYITLEGKRGYLDLRTQLSLLILEQQPVVVNSVVPDKPEIMVFAVPTRQGTYRDFDYEAIAITYNNSDLVEALKISTFDGDASTFAVLPDGRVVVDNGSEDMQDIYNFLAMLKDSGSLTDRDLEDLRHAFLSGGSGDMAFELNDRDYYLVY